MWLSAKKQRTKIKCAFLHYNWPIGFHSIYKNKHWSCPLTNWLQYFISNHVNIFTFSVVVLVQYCWAFKVILRLNNTNPWLVNILHLISFTQQQTSVIMFIKLQTALVPCWKLWEIWCGKALPWQKCLVGSFEVGVEAQVFPGGFFGFLGVFCIRQKQTLHCSSEAQQQSTVKFL